MIDKNKIIKFLNNEINIIKSNEANMIDENVYLDIFNTVYTERILGKEVYVDEI